MNYFELFGIAESFLPDKQVIKQQYFLLSRKYHPDFYTKSGDDEQLDMLEMSSQVNKAYKTLLSTDETMKYLLQQKGLLEEEEKYQLPPDFLMEVMELNEQLTDARLENLSADIEHIKNNIATFQLTIYEPVKSIIENYQPGVTTNETLLQVKQYYFKKKYLNRILAAM